MSKETSSVYTYSDEASPINTILTERNFIGGKNNEFPLPELTGADVTNVDLTNVDLPGANFNGGKKRKGKKGKKNAKKTRKAKKFQEKYGSRLKVWNGTAEMTTGKLKKRDLIRVQDKNGVGRIKSKKKSMFEKKYNRLEKHGWTAKKGEFGAVRIDKKTRKNKKRGKKGKKGNRGFGFF